MVKSDKLFIVSLIFGGLMCFATTSNLVSSEREVFAIDNCDATSTCTNTNTGTGNSQTNNCTNFSDCLNEAEANNQIQTNRCDSVPGNPGGCTNTGTANDMRQSIQCRNVISCANFGGSEGLSQSIECTDVAGSCANGAFVTSNTNQELRCISVGDSGCSNDSQETGFGPGNTPNEQKLDCVFVSDGCKNVATGNQIDQNLVCARTTQCINNSTLLPVSSNTQSTTCSNAESCSNVGINTNVVANSGNCESHEPDTITTCQPGRIIIRPNS